MAVVVEDCVSASVVGNGVYVGVAVLGTSLSEDTRVPITILNCYHSLRP